jgi:hypothetical protein
MTYLYQLTLATAGSHSFPHWLPPFTTPAPASEIQGGQGILYFKVEWKESTSSIQKYKNIYIMWTRKKNQKLRHGSCDVLRLMSHFLPHTFCISSIFFNKQIIVHISRKRLLPFPTKMSLVFDQRRGYPHTKRKLTTRSYSLFPKDLALK